MSENIIKISANEDEINFYCYLGEALFKIQYVEQALLHSITLKLNPDESKKIADEFLDKRKKFTLGRAINESNKNNIYDSSLRERLNIFLDKRNWLAHGILQEIQHDFNNLSKRKAQYEELNKRIKLITNDAELIYHEIEYDMIKFCKSKGKDMSKLKALLELQDGGVRISS